MIFLWGSIQTWLPCIKSSWLERSRLNEVSRRGKPSVRTVKRALALLKADEGLRDREIAGVLLVNAAPLPECGSGSSRKDAAINDRPRPGRERKLDGKQEATWLPSRAESTGRTCKLDAPSAGEQGGGDGVGREHILGDGADTQKNELKPWKKKEWCSPS